jgi:YNFM family putative membrane transporter
MAATSLQQWLSIMKKTIFNRKLLGIYITGFLLMGAYTTILNYIGYPLTRPPYNLSQTTFGFLFVVNIFGIFSSVLFGRLSDKHSKRVLLGLTIIIFMTGVLLTLTNSSI